MKKIDKYLSLFEDVFTVVCFSLMSIIILIGVFYRYVLSDPLTWTEEVARYLMVWGVFIGISIVTRKRMQLGIDVLVTFAPQKYSRTIRLIANSILLFTFVAASYYAVIFVINSFDVGNLTPIMRIKFAYIYSVIPIGFILSSYRALQLLTKDYKTDTQDRAVL